MLREAARSGDLETIKSWPAGDEAINKGGQGKWTALHFGALASQLCVPGRECDTQG